VTLGLWDYKKVPIASGIHFFRQSDEIKCCGTYPGERGVFMNPALGLHVPERVVSIVDIRFLLV
jgi:hypothetical protein